MSSLLVHLNDEKNCFVTVTSLIKYNNKSPILLCEWSNNYPKSVFVTPSPNRVAKSGTIEFPISFASCLGLIQGTKIIVTTLDRTKNTLWKKKERISFTPTTKNDYDIIEQNQNELTFGILNQLNVVCKCEFPIWLGKGIYVKLRCQDDLTNNFALLYEGCEVIIKTKISRPKIFKLPRNKSLWMRIQCQFSKTPKINFMIVNGINMKQQNWKEGDFLTLFCLSWDNKIKSYVHQSRIFCISYSDKNCLIDHVIVNKVDRFILGVGPFSKVIIQKLIYNVCPRKLFLIRLNLQETKLEKIYKNFEKKKKNKLEENFLKWCRNVHYISSGGVLDLEGKLYRCYFNRPFEEYDNVVKFSYIHELPTSLECILEPGVIIIPKSLSWLGKIKYTKFIGFPSEMKFLYNFLSGHVSKKFKKFQKKKKINYKGSYPVLLGSKGSGKTHASRYIAQNLQKKEHCHILWMDCLYWVDIKFEEVVKKFQTLLAQSCFHQPSLVILDDLDLLIYNNEGVDVTIRAQQLSDRLSDLIISLREQNVAFLATAKNWITFNNDLKLPGLFSQQVSLSTLNSTKRILIIKTLVSLYEGKKIKKSVLENVEPLLEGYSSYDLDVLVSSVIRLIDSEKRSKLTIKDFEIISKAYKPYSFKKVNLKNSMVNWEDIGGLENVRQTLKETFEYPTKYKLLFETSSIKLRSGLLLYGPPGCGKTMLAAAVAKECGLNFISVKGPELFNKYIGESEKSVRNIFERASFVSPCILFFDEFDALAPRRGGDTIGVTDRVVNQLLSFLDGVESREGIYFLAATSRPDLIDTALLRPGRLDKSILCGFPGFTDRLDIITKYTKMFDVCPQTLIRLAISTIDFSGADLKAIIITSQLIFARKQLKQKLEINFLEIQENIGTLNLYKKRNIKKQLVISDLNLFEALKSTKLSISPSRRNFFKNIYETFSGNRTENYNFKQKIIQK